MADAVVDVLEIVQIEDDQGKLALVTMRAGALARERLVEEAPVMKAGEGVEVGELAGFAETMCVLDRATRAHGPRLEQPHVAIRTLVAPRAHEDGQTPERRRHPGEGTG